MKTDKQLPKNRIDQYRIDSPLMKTMTEEQQLVNKPLDSVLMTIWQTRSLIIPKKLTQPQKDRQFHTKPKLAVSHL